MKHFLLAALALISIGAIALAVEPGVNWKYGPGEPAGCVTNDNTVGALSNGSNSYQNSKCDVSGAQFSNGESIKATYSAAVAAYGGYASATDLSCLVNSTTKIGRLSRVGVSGRATAAFAFDVLLVKRSTLNTGGTPTTVTNGAHDSVDAASSLTVVTYAATPTLGNTVATYRAQQTILIPSGTAAAYNPVEFLFGVQNDRMGVLRQNQAWCLNANGTSSPAGQALNIEWKWTEE